MIGSIIRKLRARDPILNFADVVDWQRAIYERVRPYTMTSYECVLATISAIEYVVHNSIPGAIVECGVWKGGNMMAAALTLQHLGSSRPLYLYDTYEGMTTPDDVDVDYRGTEAGIEFARLSRGGDQSDWCYASLDEVRSNLAATGYDETMMNFVKGPVEQTLADRIPSEIALLRLDTDWYKSTRCELEVLYPQVSRLGVVMIDDYGCWRGARQAVDEYLSEHNIQCLLHRIDFTARQFVKI